MQQLKCPVLRLLNKYEDDLNRIQNAANIHDINNQRFILHVIKDLCSSSVCPGPQKCQSITENINNLEKIHKWVVEQWYVRFC